jgi:hypothetical protein
MAAYIGSVLVGCVYVVLFARRKLRVCITTVCRGTRQEFWKFKHRMSL